MEVKYLIYILSILLISISCNKQSNKKVTELIQLTSFNSIELNDVFEVQLIEDSSFFVEAEGHPSLEEGLNFKLEDTLLILDRKNGNRWFRPSNNKLIVRIHSQPLARVTANKTSNIKTLSPITSNEFGLIFKEKANEADLELNCNSFYYWNQDPCGGNLRLYGYTKHLKLWNYAIMSVDAKDLISKYTLVENDSQGDCSVWVTDHLDYKITGFGDIHLYGQPLSMQSIGDTGEGQLIVH
jgi:hypothetical protein